MFAAAKWTRLVVGEFGRKGLFQRLQDVANVRLPPAPPAADLPFAGLSLYGQWKLVLELDSAAGPLPTPFRDLLDATLLIEYGYETASPHYRETFAQNVLTGAAPPWQGVRGSWSWEPGLLRLGETAGAGFKHAKTSLGLSDNFTLAVRMRSTRGPLELWIGSGRVRLSASTQPNSPRGLYLHGQAYGGTPTASSEIANVFALGEWHWLQVHKAGTRITAYIDDVIVGDLTVPAAVAGTEIAVGSTGRSAVDVERVLA